MQLSFLDQLFPKEKVKATEEDKIILYDKWLLSASPLEKMIFKTYRGTWIYFYDFIDGISDIKNIAQLKVYHYGNTSKDYYIYSIKLNDEDYNLIFQLANEVLHLHNHYKDVFQVPIRFPACEMSFYNLKGDAIDFNIRENFIMNGLGFKNARMHTSFKDCDKEFCNTEMYLKEIIDYLTNN